jgi:predicted nucleic acid-binding protein
VPTTTPAYVVDTSVIVDLYAGGLLDELFRLPFRLLTADAIVTELQVPDGQELAGQGLAIGELSSAQVLEVYQLAGRYRRVSTNDLFALVLARSLHATLLTSDGHLIKAAQEQGVTVHGTLWILDQLVRAGLITPPAAAEGLQRMLATGSRLPHTECRRRLEKWV